MNSYSLIKNSIIISIVIGIFLSLLLWNILFLFGSVTIESILISIYILNIHIKYTEEVDDFYDKTVGDISSVLNTVHGFMKKNEFMEYDGNVSKLFEYLNSYKSNLVSNVNNMSRSKLTEKKMREGLSKQVLNKDKK